MKTIFIDTIETGVKTIAEAEEYAPWAAVIIEVEGGFMAFESANDAATWKNQI